MHTLSRLAIALGALLLSGCGAAEAMREGQAVGEALFDARSGGRNEAALALYGDPFYQSTPKADWLGMTAHTSTSGSAGRSSTSSPAGT
jgi:hypothetical protein